MKLNQWNPESMKNAIKEYQNENNQLSMRCIARAWNVPYATLRKRLNGEVTGHTHMSGRPTVLSQQAETELVHLIQDLAAVGFPLTRNEVRELAYAYAEHNNITGFSLNKQKAGYYWFEGFLNRHANLTLKKPEDLSVGRAMAMNKPQITMWFETYNNLLTDLGVKDSPSHLWNFDETGVVNIAKCKEVVAEVGKQALTVVQQERGELSTVLVGVNAMGNYLPPLVIHKGMRIGRQWLNGASFDVLVKASPNGWINKELFLQFGRNFIASLERLELVDGRPHVVILDNHASHLFNLDFLLLMKQHNIHVVGLPSHCSHWLQPLDRGPFASFKRHWNELLRRYTREMAGRKLDKAEFFRVFNPAWDKSMTVAAAQSSFRNTGLFPVNADSIPDHAFDPSKTSERTTAPVEQPEISLNGNTHVAAYEDVHTCEESPPATCIITAVSTSSSHTPGTSFQVPVPLETGNVSRRHIKARTTATETMDFKSTCSTSGAAISSNHTTSDVSFMSILPLPHRERNVARRQRAKPPSFILTGDDTVKFVEDRGKVAEKKVKKVKSTRKSKPKQKKLGVSKKCENVDPSLYCGLCDGYFYDDNANEQWIQCPLCLVWYHEVCANVRPGIRDFVCDECVN